jgi:hypothetical protein
MFEYIDNLDICINELHSSLGKVNFTFLACLIHCFFLKVFKESLFLDLIEVSFQLCFYPKPKEVLSNFDFIGN